MVYENGRWSLFFVWKLTPKEVVGYKVYKQDANLCSLKFFKLHLGDHIMLNFVSIYGLEGVRDSAYVNEVDGKLNCGSSPSSVYLPLPAHCNNNIVDLPSLHDSSWKKNVNVKCRRRRVRGKKKNRKTPQWLRSSDSVEQTLCVHLLLDDVRNDAAMKYCSSVTDKKYFAIRDVGTVANNVSNISRFFFVDSQVVRDVNCQSQNQAESLLENQSGASFLYREFEYSCMPLRVFISDTDQFSKLKECKDNVYDAECNIITYKSEKPNSKILGVMVSVWFVEEQSKHLFTIEDARHVQDRFGTFFGSRTSVPCRGINGYLGRRLSHQSNITPTHGPGTTFTASYFRGYYNKDHLHYPLQGKIRRSADMVLSASKKFNDAYIQFVGDKTCNRLIWTQGAKERNITHMTSCGDMIQTNKSLAGKYIGFFNKLHVDKQDQVRSDELWDVFHEKIKNYSNLPGHKNIVELQRLIDFGLPTTCGYNFTSNRGEEKHIEGWFLMGRIAVPLVEGAVHHFMGWSFPHCTSVPYIRRRNKIITLNLHDEESYILAWGSSGGTQHAVAATVEV